MYNRLFTKILDSSVWLEQDATRIVWITFLAAMDEDGYCDFSCDETLARRANVPLEKVKEAVKVLESPDPFSPHDEFEGRRIERVGRGWLVLKAPHYRQMLSREIQREQTRIRVARFRAKQSSNKDSVTERYESYGNKSNDKQSAEYRSKVQSTVHQIASTQTIVWSKADSWQGISDEDLTRWTEAYPACAVPRQLKAMEEWLLSHPAKAKKSNWRRFITNWLSRSQDRGGDDRGKQLTVKTVERQMSAFEIEKRCGAIGEEINKIFRQNGNKRVEGDGIDELKNRRDELKRMLTK